MTCWGKEPHGASLGYSQWSGGKRGAEVFCFLLVQKWNGYQISQGIMFIGIKQVLWETNTKINHRRTEVCNISIFGCILFPVHSEVKWLWIFLWSHVRGHKVNTLGENHKN
jgi:hypothetical protein